MEDRLGRYRSMRDFSATPEPEGTEPAPPTDLPRFVVQEHHARRLHWDLRLERDGVLASWAVPKGIPVDPRENHLAVHTEDHPLMYLDFSGDIPKGSYGAGTMSIWDRGTYETHKFSDREVMVTFHGERVTGRYVLFRTRENDWMIHRMDPPEDPTREPMPTGLRPMLAVDGPLPDDGEAWAFEFEWAGRRVVVYSEGGRARIEDATGHDISARLPEARELGGALGTTAVVLDGVVMALDRAGRPDRERLRQRLAAGSDSTVRRLRRESPVALVLFDVLWLDGHPTTGLPYSDRRSLLDGFGLAGPAWQVPAAHVGEGRALLEAARLQALPAVLAKRLGSPYEPGTRSNNWVRAST